MYACDGYRHISFLDVEPYRHKSLAGMYLIDVYLRACQIFNLGFGEKVLTTPPYARKKLGVSLQVDECMLNKLWCKKAFMLNRAGNSLGSLTLNRNCPIVTDLPGFARTSIALATNYVTNNCDTFLEAEECRCLA